MTSAVSASPSQGWGDEGAGQRAMFERVPAASGAALWRARVGGLLRVGTVGGELFWGDAFGTGHMSIALVPHKQLSV
jgi:hypothetical protein